VRSVTEEWIKYEYKYLERRPTLQEAYLLHFICLQLGLKPYTETLVLDQLTHEAEPFLRNRQLRSYPRTSQHFMERERSLPWREPCLLEWTLCVAPALLVRSRISSCLLPWRWRPYVPPKRRITQFLHGTTSQKTSFFIVTAMKTSNRSLPCPQEPSTGSYPKPDQSSLYHPILFLNSWGKRLYMTAALVTLPLFLQGWTVLLLTNIEEPIVVTSLDLNLIEYRCHQIFLQLVHIYSEISFCPAQNEQNVLCYDIVTYRGFAWQRDD
jgi:hypothetical protein